MILPISSMAPDHSLCPGTAPKPPLTYHTSQFYASVSKSITVSMHSTNSRDPKHVPSLACALTDEDCYVTS